MRASFLGHLAFAVSTIAQSSSTVSSASTTVTGLGSATATNASTVPIISINEPVTGTLNATAWSLIVRYDSLCSSTI